MSNSHQAAATPSFVGLRRFARDMGRGVPAQCSWARRDDVTKVYVICRPA